MMAEVISSPNRPIIGVERQGRHRKSPDHLYSLDCTVKGLSESPNPVLQICEPAAKYDPIESDETGIINKNGGPGFRDLRHVWRYAPYLYRQASMTRQIRSNTSSIVPTPSTSKYLFCLA